MHLEIIRDIPHSPAPPGNQAATQPRQLTQALSMLCASQLLSNDSPPTSALNRAAADPIHKGLNSHNHTGRRCGLIAAATFTAVILASFPVPFHPYPDSKSKVPSTPPPGWVLPSPYSRCGELHLGRFAGAAEKVGGKTESVGVNND